MSHHREPLPNAKPPTWTPIGYKLHQGSTPLPHAIEIGLDSSGLLLKFGSDSVYRFFSFPILFGLDDAGFAVAQMHLARNSIPDIVNKRWAEAIATNTQLDPLNVTYDKANGILGLDILPRQEWPPVHWGAHVCGGNDTDFMKPLPYTVYLDKCKASNEVLGLRIAGFGKGSSRPKRK